MTAEHRPENDDEQRGKDEQPPEPRRLFDRLPQSEEKIQTPSSITTAPLEGEVMPEDSNDADKADAARSAHDAILKTRQILTTALRGADDETREMVREILLERLEQEKITAMNNTDALLIETLRNQVAQTNSALTDFYGEKTSILSLYNQESEANPDAYPPLNTVAGLYGVLKLHRELSTKILSTAVVASEMAEAESNKAIIPLHKEVRILKIQADKEVAEKYTGSAEALKRAARDRAEVNAQKVRGVATVVSTAFAETPVILVKAPTDKVGEMIKDSDDKVATISALAGALGGPFALVIYGPTLSPILATWISNFPWGTLSAAGVGIVGGAIGGYVAWTAVRLGAEWTWKITRDSAQAISDKIGQKLEEVKQAQAERRAEKLREKLAQMNSDNDDNDI